MKHRRFFDLCDRFILEWAGFRGNPAGKSIAAFRRMASFKDFREIRAWRLAHQMSVRVDVFLACPEFRRHFKCCDQLSDAARSAPRNIAEGHGRLKQREFANFVRTAKGLEKEVLEHLLAAHEQFLITTDELIINKHLAKRAMRAASGLIRYLESTAHRL